MLTGMIFWSNGLNLRLYQSVQMGYSSLAPEYCENWNQFLAPHCEAGPCSAIMGICKVNQHVHPNTGTKSEYYIVCVRPSMRQVSFPSMESKHCYQQGSKGTQHEMDARAGTVLITRMWFSTFGGLKFKVQN